MTSLHELLTQQPGQEGLREMPGMDAAPTVPVLAARRGVPLGVVPYVFGYSQLAASQTNLQAHRTVAAATPKGVQLAVRPPYTGSVVGLCVMGSSQMTAGVCTFSVFVNGVSSGATSSLVLVGDPHTETTFAAGNHPFSAGDALDVRVSTDASFLPTTLDIEVLLYTQQAAS